MINDLSKSSQNNECIQQVADGNGNVIKDKNVVAELLNHFVINNPISLLKYSNTTFNETLLTEFLQNMMPFETSFELPLITATMVQFELQKIPLCKATGADGLSPRILKIAASAISPSVARLLNHCITTHKGHLYERK